MKIQIDPHTIEKANERGASEKEIIDVLTSGEQLSGKYNRLGKSKVFHFNKQRNGKHYQEKKIEVYYVIENKTMITVTVYVFYGKWSN